MAADEALLSAYARTRDPEASAEIVRRYAGLVYATCLRVTGDPHDAEDAAQDSFFSLARKAGDVRSSLPGWLHATARNASLAIVEKSRKRRAREAKAPVRGNAEPTWSDVEPYVDAAIQALPEELRAPVILHFLEGESQPSIAARLGVNQSTVSRRLKRGVAELRKRLEKAGVVVSVAALVTILAASPAQAAPAALTATLGKIGLAGVGKAASATAASHAPLLVVSGVASAVVVLLFVIAGRPPSGGPAFVPPSRSMAPQDKREGKVSQVKKDRVVIDGVPARPIGDRWDAMLRGLQVILEYRGEKVTMDELMAWSGDAFNLCHGEHWQMTARLRTPTDTLSNVAEALGYKGRWRSYGQDRAFIRDRAEADLFTERTLSVIREEIDAGRPVFAVGASDQGCGSYSVLVGYGRAKPEFCHAGLSDPYRWVGIRGVAFPNNPADPSSLSGHWNGQVRHPDCRGGWEANPIFILGAKGKPPDERTRSLAALRRAVSLSEAKSYRYAFWKSEFYFGSQAYGKWDRALRELDYPGDVVNAPEGLDWYDLGCMDTQVDQIVRGRAAAAAFCERAAEVLPKAAYHLRDAARWYRREVETAKAAFAAFLPAFHEDAARREAFWRDPARRAAGASAVDRLRQWDHMAVQAVRNALVVAESEAKPVLLADACEQFITAFDEQERWRPRSFVNAHVAFLRANGIPADFTTLSTLSGYGVSFHYDRKRFEGGWLSPAGSGERIERAVGARVQWRRVESLDEAWSIIRRELDAGRAVRTPWIEESLICGYRDAPDKADRRVYIVCCPFMWPGAWWTWKDLERWIASPMSGKGYLAWLEGRTEPAPEDETALVGLRLIVKLAYDDTREDMKWLQPCVCGLRAIDAFATDIADLDVKAKDFAGGWLGCHAIYPQWTTRRHTAAWLRKVAPRLPEAARPHVLKAAEAYELAHKAWLTWESLLGDREHNAFRGAWDDPDHRTRGAEAVREAARHERAAVDEVERALAAIGEGGPKVVDLLSPEELPRWKPTPAYENAPPWRFRDGAYEGFRSWVAHPDVFGDFVLEVEVLFSGAAEGGIVLRGEAASREPWNSGYELDIDGAREGKHGHIHFPCKPKPYIGDALIEIGKWTPIEIRAKGRTVSVYLKGQRVLIFADPERSEGNICLEGHADGVKYRKLRVRPLGD